MNARAPGRYHRLVHIPRLGIARILIAGALISLAMFLAGAASAAAAVVSYDVGDQSIVRYRGKQSDVVVRTWERNTVQVEWNDGEPVTAFKGPYNWNRTAIPVPPVQNMKEYEGPNGVVTASFPPEDFPIPQMAQGLHDAVEITEGQVSNDIGRPVTDLSHVTITIPASTRQLIIGNQRGDVQLSNYTGTTLVFAGGSRVIFSNVSGDAFVQSMNNHIYFYRSNFERLRVRTNHADQLYEGCRIRQIEATTLTGSIVFDGGSFEPGLARFESDRGSIAIGVFGNAQFGLHSGDGHIFTMAGRAANAVTQNGTDVNFAFGNGGPVVNATSMHGNVFAYNGSLSERQPRLLPVEWRTMLVTIASRRRNLPANLAFPRTPGRAVPENVQTPLVDRQPHD
jgi:hypothetical protein